MVLSDKFRSCKRANAALRIKVVRLFVLFQLLAGGSVVETEQVVFVLGSAFVPRDRVHFAIDPLHCMDRTVNSLHLLQSFETPL